MDWHIFLNKQTYHKWIYASIIIALGVFLYLDYGIGFKRFFAQGIIDVVNCFFSFTHSAFYIYIHNDSLQINNAFPTISMYSILGMRYSILFYALVLIFEKSHKKMLVYSAIYTASSAVLSGIVMILFCVFGWFQLHAILFSFVFETGLLMGLFAYVLYKERLYKRIFLDNSISQYMLQWRIPYLIMVALFAMWIQVLLYYSYFKELLAQIILIGSKFLLIIIGYTPSVYGRNIRGDGAWLGVMNPCLGIQVLIIFTFVLLLFRGDIRRKFTFLCIGWISIVFLNILRIVGLYIYVSKNEGMYSGIINTHDIYNYPVYTLVVILWFVYLRKK